MMNVDVAIVGAGPYGLSIAAHLKREGLEVITFGKPMQTWLQHMPQGMYLKSEGFASNLYDPDRKATLRRHCEEQGDAYQDLGKPVPLATFQEYGLAFQRRCVPELDTRSVTWVEQESRGYTVTLEDGEIVSARRVVLAVGISHYAYLPPQLRGFPKSIVSHTSEHTSLASFNGQKVVVVGAGSSALDTLKLLLDQGADAELAARTETIRFHAPPPTAPRSLISELRAPMSGLGPGWRSRLCTDAPLVFHAMPQRFRHKVVRKHLGPAPCWWTNNEAVRRTPMHLGYSVAGVRSIDRGLSLRMSGPTKLTLEADHVIAGTGYKVDLDRLSFLAPSLRSAIQTEEGGYPRLSRNFEASTPGLYFVGLSSAGSFGPMVRFAYGAGYTARNLAKHLGRHAVGGRNLRSVREHEYVSRQHALEPQDA